MVEIRKVAVIGAGVMGAGIAAQIANAGVPVQLLDIVPDGTDDRDAIAKGAIGKLLKADPAPLMHKRNAKLITPGNIEDHMERLADCDWIIEAVIENLAIKRNLYERIAAVRRADAVISSNTSTIPLKELTEGMDDSLRRHFLITHFFNPPRYMRLFELVAGSEHARGRERCDPEFCRYLAGQNRHRRQGCAWFHRQSDREPIGCNVRWSKQWITVWTSRPRTPRSAGHLAFPRPAHLGCSIWLASI